MALAVAKAAGYFAKNPLPAITLIHGEEPLLVQEALDAARRRAKEDGFSERQRIDLDRDAIWKTLINEIHTPSLFAPKRLVELHFEDAKLRKTASDVLQKIAAPNKAMSGIRLLLHAPNLQRPQSAVWFKALLRAKCLEIRSYPLEQRDFERQIERRLGKAGLRLDNPAREQLIAYVEGNLLAAVQAIERLSQRPDHENILSATELRETLSDLSRFGNADFRQALLQARWLDAYRMAGKIAAENAAQISLIVWQLDRDISLLLQLKTTAPGRWNALFSDYRVYSRAQRDYEKALPHFTPGTLIKLLKLAGKLDRTRKGAEPGDPWLTLRQYLLLRAQNG